MAADGHRRADQEFTPGEPAWRAQPTLNAEHTAVLRQITQEHPHALLETMARELFHRTGMKVSTVASRKTLRQAGIE